MVNSSSCRTRNAVRRGALGLALALPLLTTLPARAQAEADSDQSSEEQIQLEDALTGDSPDSQSAPQSVEVEAFEDGHPLSIRTAPASRALASTTLRRCRFRGFP